jgi:hypothetical protein
VGSGGYAPEKINTDAGLLVYPKLLAEYALTKDLGLSLSGGYLVAPKGTSKNVSFGVGLTHHIRVGEGRSFSSDAGGLPTYQAFRVSLFHQTDTGVRFRDIDRGQLQMIGIQADAIVNDHLYIPVQGTVAYTTYLGYPGYGELLAGVGLQSRADPGDRWQVFGQLMAGTNVHGVAVKASSGVRYVVSDRMSLHLAVGQMEARNSVGDRFKAGSVGLGLDYRFSIPTW